jgi:hypothetical protein
LDQASSLVNFIWRHTVVYVSSGVFFSETFIFMEPTMNCERLRKNPWAHFDCPIHKQCFDCPSFPELDVATQIKTQDSVFVVIILK